MKIGVRLRELREQKGMSQGDVEKSTGLLRCYTSRVECGHTVPSLETLGKYAAVFKVPVYRLFYDGDGPPPVPHLTLGEDLKRLAKVPGRKGEEARFLLKLKSRLNKLQDPDRELVLGLARKFSARER